MEKEITILCGETEGGGFYVVSTHLNPARAEQTLFSNSNPSCC